MPLDAGVHDARMRYKAALEAGLSHLEATTFANGTMKLAAIPQKSDKPRFILKGMFGIGDNIHQRAVVRALMQEREVWLLTCHVALYHDLRKQGLKLLYQPTSLRAQARTIKVEKDRYRGSYEKTLPLRVETKRLWYHKVDIDKYGPIVKCMFGVLGLPIPEYPDFSLPVPDEWHAKAQVYLSEWNARRNGRPLLIYRPIVLRREWDGKMRNPEWEQYKAIFDSIRDRFFVVSVADLLPGAEWIVGNEQAADVKLHHGQLDFETMAALWAAADMVFTPAGFGPVLAQAVGAPSITVYGGRESYKTTQIAGAHLAPTLGIDPDKTCDCHSHSHACQKNITLAPAIARAREFVDQCLRSSSPQPMLTAKSEQSLPSNG